MAEKIDQKTFEKAIKDVLFNKPQHHGKDNHPTREELEKKWKLEQQTK